MKKNPIIALAQIKYFDISKNHNLEKIKRYIRLAKKKHADIVCFPESCITRRTIELHLDHKIIREIREECKKNSIWCIVTEDMRIKGKFYNVAILIDRNGKIKGHYKKIHLFGDKVNAGKKIRTFQTDFGKIGIVICWDVAFSKLFKSMRKAGAEIVFCPAQWWYDAPAHDEKPKERELKLLESLLLARAYENLYFVAMCNPVMDSKYQISYSAIASPMRILKKIIGKEGLITAEINLSHLNKFKKLYAS